MSWIGEEVHHFKWGKGTVKAQRHGDNELFIQFENGVITWIRKKTVTRTSEGSMDTIIVQPPDIEKMPETQNDAHINRRAIESFKLGIVPPFVKNFIFGRDREIEYINKWLNQDIHNYLLLFGEYGTGKSHFLRYIQEIALEKNYAVSHCSLDPEESPLSKPKMVYRNIVSNFQWMNDNGFREYIMELANRNPSRKRGNPYIENIIRHPKNEEIFWKWIEGDDVIKTIDGFPSLYPWSTAANIFCNLLSAFGHFAVNEMNMDGLLLLFDEAESLQFPYAYSYQYSRGINFFKGLLLTASNDPRLLSEQISISTPRTGFETELIYCGFSQIPYLYENPSGLKVLFTFTPSDVIRQFCVEIGFDRYLQLERLTEDDKVDVVNAIQQIYRLAYPGIHFSDVERTIIKEKALEYGRDNIRNLLKCTIEAMDLCRHNEDEPLEELLI